MKILFCVLSLILCATGAVQAQSPLFKKALEGAMNQYKVSARSSASRLASQNYVKKLARADIQEMEQLLGALLASPPKGVVALKPFMAHNMVLGEKTLLNWFSRDEYLLSHRADLLEKVKEVPVTGAIDYVRLIPPSARIILLGELHEKDAFVREIESAVRQYQKAYPEKNVYYASEFVDDLLPGSPVPAILNTTADVLQTVRKRPYYVEVTKRLVNLGVRVVGLEDPRLSAQFLQERTHLPFDQSPTAWRAMSAVGVQERNQYWAGIIQKIMSADSDAVVFIHAGMGHTNYNQITPLPWMLKKWKPFVIEINSSAFSWINPILEKYAPFSIELQRYRRNLEKQNPFLNKKLRVLRIIKDKRLAVSLGCDVSVFFPSIPQ